ncbi:MAG: hypothetical protein MUF24_12110 [Chitinophagaceae bacterium]|jgi:hypothetical protein|nr:hypothetical protein [Chitinophagaceae bacterium]
MLKQVRAYCSVLLLCLLFVGCIEITESVKLNENGTGHFGIKIDMGKMFDDPMMKTMMESSEKSKEIDNIDSIIYFKDLPDSVIKDNPELWSRAKMHVVTRLKENKFYVEVDFDFKNVEEIAYFAANYNKIMDASKANPLSNSSNAEEGEGQKQPEFMANGLSYRLEGKTLVRKATAAPGDKEPEGDEKEMMKSFLSGAVYKIQFDLPGKIQKSTFADGKIEGTRLTCETTLLDIMEQKKDMNGEVRFK